MDEIIGVYSENLISIVFRRGDGTKENPVRLVKQYRELNDNKLIFEIDPFISNQNIAPIEIKCADKVMAKINKALSKPNSAPLRI